MAIATNKEFLNQSLARFGMAESDVEMIIVENPDLDPDAKVDAKACKLAIYNSMSSILPAMSQNISEGGYSVSWNVEGIKMWYSSLCRELVKEDMLTKKRPKVRNRSNCW